MSDPHVMEKPGADKETVAVKSANILYRRTQEEPKMPEKTNSSSKRDPLAVVVVTAFLALVGWIAAETYNQGDRLARLETGIKNLDRTVSKLDTTIGSLPANIQAAVAPVIHREIQPLTQNIDTIKEGLKWVPLATHQFKSLEDYQALINNMSGDNEYKVIKVQRTIEEE